MSSLSAKDRVSLCQFTFADGRRCRSHRFGNHPRFCPDHAQKEARAQAAESLCKDLAYFFSGDYLSACDLSTALGRLIPAVIRGDVKPRAARTIAYMAQTLLQTIHLAEHEYSNTFGSDGWRKSIRNSVNGNYNHRFPPAQPAAPQSQSAPTPVAHPFRGEASRFAGTTSPAPPPTSARQSQPPTSHPADTPVSCHSDVVAQAGISPHRVGRPEESAISSSPAPSSTPPLAPHPPASHPAANIAKTPPIPPTPSSAPPIAPTPQPNHLPPQPPVTPSRSPNKGAWQQFFHIRTHLL